MLACSVQAVKIASKYYIEVLCVALCIRVTVLLLIRRVCWGNDVVNLAPERERVASLNLTVLRNIKHNAGDERTAHL